MIVYEWAKEGMGSGRNHPYPLHPPPSGIMRRSVISGGGDTKPGEGGRRLETSLPPLPPLPLRPDWNLLPWRCESRDRRRGDERDALTPLSYPSHPTSPREGRGTVDGKESE